MAMFVVHQSTIKCWRACHRKYWYRYVRNLIKRKPPAPLLRGTVVHEMLEADANGVDPFKPFRAFKKKFKSLFVEEQETYGDMPGEIKTLMTGYFEYYKKDPLVAVEFNGRKSEHKFRVNLTPNIIIEGKIDRIGRDKAKHNWLMDHKTVKQLPSGDGKYSDIQSAIYSWVMPRVGFKNPWGVVWDYIRWKAPTQPELLKNGSMSRRANIDTTWAVYEAALIENNLDPAEYADMKEILAGKESDFYVRTYMPIPKVMQETLIDEAITTAREIKRKGGVDKTRTTDKHCDWCEYKALCMAELRGLDTHAMLKTDFVEKEVDEDETDEAA
jgi:hypothetical protein